MKSLISIIMSTLAASMLNASDGALSFHEKKLSAYDVVWTSPSEDWNGTMPLGNGDIGMNLMVNPQGEVEFYLSKGDAWDDLGRLVKLGKGTLTLDPKPDLNAGFSQKLSLIEGAIHLELGGQIIRFWIDANAPVLRIDIESTEPTKAKLAIELWRNEPYEQQWVGWSDVYHENNLGVIPMVQPDTVVRGLEDQIMRYHHNKQSPWKTILEVQSLDGIRQLGYEDPLLHRTFGVVAGGRNFRAAGELSLESIEASRKQSLDLVALTEHPSTPAEWQASIENHYDTIQAEDRERAWTAHHDFPDLEKTTTTKCCNRAI